MSTISDILTSAHDERVETKILLLEQEPNVLYEIIDRIKIILKKNRLEDMAQLSNYDLFKLYFCFNNDSIALIQDGQAQYFDSPASYEELYNIIDESEQLVNGWTFSKEYNLIRRACEAKTQKDLIAACQQLGLNPYITGYDIKQVFIALTNLLFYKAEVKRILASKKAPSLMKKEIRDLYNKILKQTIDIVVERYDSTKKFYRERKEACQIKMQCLEELIAKGDSGELETMDLIEGVWHQYLDPSVLNPLYDLLLDNQYKRHTKVVEGNKQIKDKINETPFINYLYENNINPKSFTEANLKRLNEMNIEELQRKIDFFKRLGFELKDILTTYLEYLFTTDINTITKLTFYLDKNIVLPNTLKIDLSVLNKLPLIELNYSILKPIIDINDIYYDDKILFLDTKEIKRRISILGLYNLSKHNYMFLLSNFRYLPIYDLLIENNIPLYLFITICKTTNPLLTIKKIMICKELDIPYENNGILTKEIKRDNSFMCPDENVDEYIEDCTNEYMMGTIKTSTVEGVKNSPTVENLDARYRRGDTYVFGSTRISRPKAISKLQTLKNDKKDIDKYLFFALISNSILNEKNIQEIKSSISLQKK